MQVSLHWRPSKKSTVTEKLKVETGKKVPGENEALERDQGQEPLEMEMVRKIDFYLSHYSTISEDRSPRVVALQRAAKAPEVG